MRRKKRPSTPSRTPRAQSLSLSALDLLTVDQDEGEHRALPWYNRLWAAVLRRAAVDWVLYNGHTTPKLSKLGHDAHSWIFLEEDVELKDSSSFASVCASLNVEVVAMRERIASVTEEEARRLRGLDFDDDDC